MSETALVTGASSGIGAELAREHAARHGDVVLVARRTDRIEELARELSSEYDVTATAIPADLSSAAAIEKLLIDVADRGIQIDVLVNNAGFGALGATTAIEWPQLASMIDVNVRAVTQLTRALLPGMIDRGYGRILNVASTAAFLAGPMMSVYYASKAFVVSFSQAVAAETKGTGVSVTALCPGPTATEFQRAARMESVRLFSRLGKVPTAAEVATFGYRQMVRKRRIAIPGLMNRLIVFSTRLTPRRVLASVAMRLHETD